MKRKLFERMAPELNFTAYGVTLSCTRLAIPSCIAYKISFSSSREPIVVTIAKRADDDYFWTSIPEGRQKEAEGIGKLIEAHLEKEK